MALVDPSLDNIVIRVVYDGPAFAGKTTSVRALGNGLGVRATAPAEVEGRTVYFDWLEYTGGMFEGRRIRCQVVSVPGQTVLASRRRYLLESADVVVFVADSSREAFPEAISYLKALYAVLQKADGPPIGIVLQANKRDQLNSVPVAEFQAALDDLNLRVAIIESIGTQGVGIRESFVFAVRLALDRVRDLMTTNSLRSAKPQINSAEQLLTDLLKAETDSMNTEAQSGVQGEHPVAPLPKAIAESALDEAAADYVAVMIDKLPVQQIAVRAIPPNLPRSELPSGMIWPPVNGRLFLHEALSNPIKIALDEQGNWISNGTGLWKILSPKDACFDSLDLGREALIKWARLHTSSLKVISPQRCIVLAEDGSGKYRLWQVVRKGRSLADELNDALHGSHIDAASCFLKLPQSFLRAAERWNSAGCRLSLEIGNIGTDSDGGHYLGHMPSPLKIDQGQHQGEAQLLGELTSQVISVLPIIRAKRSELLIALSEVNRRSDHGPGAGISWARDLLNLQT